MIDRLVGNSTEVGHSTYCSAKSKVNESRGRENSINGYNTRSELGGYLA